MNNPIKTYAVLAALVLLAACQPVTHEGKGIGVVFMHGRGGANPTGGGTGDLVRSMERYGVSVAAARMPWAGSRGEPDYSGTMEDALALVKAEIARLRAAGNGIIILGGNERRRLIGHRHGSPLGWHRRRHGDRAGADRGFDRWQGRPSGFAKIDGQDAASGAPAIGGDSE